jgi:hypothetical protein
VWCHYQWANKANLHVVVFVTPMPARNASTPLVR